MLNDNQNCGEDQVRPGSKALIPVSGEAIHGNKQLLLHLFGKAPLVK